MAIKGQLKHLAMCAPMFIIAAILIVGGAGVAAVLLFTLIFDFVGIDAMTRSPRSG